MSVLTNFSSPYMPVGPAVMVSLGKPDASRCKERRIATEARPYSPWRIEGDGRARVAMQHR
jgi:hypothetical protein